MPKIIARAATTGLVERGGVKTMITKEAIDSITDQSNGEMAIPYTVGHNPFCLPIGKIEHIWIEPYKDGYAAMVQIHKEDTYTKLHHHRSGAELISLDFEDSPKPFLQRKHDNREPGQHILSVDLATFAKPQDYEAFVGDVRLIDDAVACDNRIQRHSLGPEPLIQIVIADPGVAAALTIGCGIIIKGTEKFVTYVANRALQKTADSSIDVICKRIKGFSQAYKRRRPHDKRAVVTKIIIQTQPELILLTKTQIDQDFRAIELSGLVQEMEKYGDILQEASSATFTQVDRCIWRFEFCTTRSGKVIGSIECYERTKEMNKEIEEREGRGISLGGYASYERTDQNSESIGEEHDSEPDDA